MSTRRAFFRQAGWGAASQAAALRGAGGAPAPRIDFRYAPGSWQTAFCFPDDHWKSLTGERGELRCGNPGRGKNIGYFSLVAEFSLCGMEADRVARQELESPGVPIIHTRIDRPEAFLELTAFATNRAGDGRVDNVILEVWPRTRDRIRAVPRIVLHTRRELRSRENAVYDGDRLVVASNLRLGAGDIGHACVVTTPEGVAAYDRPLRCFLRFPQEGQTVDQVRAGIAEPDALLREARAYWRNWKPFGGPVGWKMAGAYDEFLVACARNILQAREVRDGKLTFQVGPTCYRGLWVVDGHFILESARYLGYDAEAQQGLETTWARQQPDGSLVAGGGKEHWKDTGIAMFTLVRQAELAQDWSGFRRMEPEVLKSVRFLEGLAGKGPYGLLAPGFGDGGLGGIRPEFTNTIWVLAGLQAVAAAAERLGMARLEPARQLHARLRRALTGAVGQEMRRHPAGFDYLPMLMKQDPQWNAPDPWDRPRPQNAQWALSHAIYPGLVFAKDDPVVRGHISLMQASTREEVPVETGWLPHEGVWNYNAAFAAHVYLWAGLADWARLTFNGFLNHASPLYCWREEQPLKGSALAQYVGDMPHNWASAECVLYLRHLLALEDGQRLRLLAGVGDPELAAMRLSGSPTRFGRVSMELEPASKGWRLRFERAGGPAPEAVELPADFSEVSGASSRREGGAVLVDPAAKSWTALRPYA